MGLLGRQVEDAQCLAVLQSKTFYAQTGFSTSIAAYLRHIPALGKPDLNVFIKTRHARFNELGTTLVSIRISAMLAWLSEFLLQSKINQVVYEVSSSVWFKFPDKFSTPSCFVMLWKI